MKQKLRYSQLHQVLTDSEFFFIRFNFLFGSRSILWSHWLLLFWTSCVLPHGFQIQSGYLTLSCLCAVILKVTTSVTPAFSINRGVQVCIRHGWPGSSHMHWDLNHQQSGELLSGAWLSQMGYRLSYSAGHTDSELWTLQMFRNGFQKIAVLVNHL